MSKMNVKESLLEVVKSNNLEILKIDLFNDFELFVREGTRVRNEYCKTYATLDDLDFEVEAFLLNDEVRGIVYCQDKDTKEPVWIEPWSDECYSWWQVSRVPKFYKRNTLNEVKLLLISARNRFRSAIDGVMIPSDERYREKSKVFEELEKALEEFENETMWVSKPDKEDKV